MNPEYLTSAIEKKVQVEKLDRAGLLVVVNQAWVNKLFKLVNEGIILDDIITENIFL